MSSRVSCRCNVQKQSLSSFFFRQRRWISVSSASQFEADETLPVLDTLCERLSACRSASSNYQWNRVIVEASALIARMELKSISGKHRQLISFEVKELLKSSEPLLSCNLKDLCYLSAAITRLTKILGTRYLNRTWTVLVQKRISDSVAAKLRLDLHLPAEERKDLVPLISTFLSSLAACNSLHKGAVSACRMTLFELSEWKVPARTLSQLGWALHRSGCMDADMLDRLETSVCVLEDTSMAPKDVCLLALVFAQGGRWGGTQKVLGFVKAGEMLPQDIVMLVEACLAATERGTYGHEMGYSRE